MDKYLEEGIKLKKLYQSKNRWSDKEFRKAMTGKLHELQRTIKVDKYDFLHELILLYSDIDGNMLNLGDLNRIDDWQEAGYSFLSGFYGIKEY